MESPFVELQSRAGRLEIPETEELTYTSLGQKFQGRRQSVGTRAQGEG